MEEDAYHALCAYTLTRGDVGFIHQHVVDAWAAQHASDRGKPIAITFALVGLYLLIERQFTGRQIQRAHMRLAQRKPQWPVFVLPAERGSITALDVIAAAEGPPRDLAIHRWCSAVWQAYAGNRDTVVALLRENGLLPGP